MSEDKSSHSTTKSNTHFSKSPEIAIGASSFWLPRSQMSHAVDLELGVGVDRRHSHSHSRSIAGSDVSDEGSCYSQFFSTTGGSYDEYSFAFVVVSDESSHRASSAMSECCSAREAESESLGNGDENGVCESDKARLGSKVVERDCRICHLGLESDSHESGAPIELGCSCKDDLGSAHKNCAEAWFKIKGNKTCEICQSIARNIAEASEIELAEQSVESNNTATVAAVSGLPTSEARSFWHGHRFLNFLLACMVFAFVVSWLFHFNVSS